ncbi:MAG: hypothetical protein V3S94_01830, partial [Gammaproteobacteria bacterium]
SVDIEEALGAVLPMAGLGTPPPNTFGAAPMPRVCARYALQIARSIKLAERAGEVGDALLDRRMQGQIELIVARAAGRCPTLIAV